MPDRADYHRKWYRANREKIALSNQRYREENREKRAEWARAHTAKITARVAARRDALLAVQGGKCAICGTEDPGNSHGWHLDHDHNCCPGKPRTSCGKCDRGVLCKTCNVLIVGTLERYPERVIAAQEYLTRDSLALPR